MVNKFVSSLVNILIEITRASILLSLEITNSRPSRKSIDPISRYGVEIEGGSRPAEARRRGRDKLTVVDEWAHPDQLVRFDGIVHDYPAEHRI